MTAPDGCNSRGPFLFRQSMVASVEPERRQNAGVAGNDTGAARGVRGHQGKRRTRGEADRGHARKNGKQRSPRFAKAMRTHTARGASSRISRT
jgi:hypothetical protein